MVLHITDNRFSHEITVSCIMFGSTEAIIKIILGMSFGVRFKVRTFGNKHPDGSNVRIFFFIFVSDHSIYIQMYVNRVFL